MKPCLALRFASTISIMLMLSLPLAAAAQSAEVAINELRALALRYSEVTAATHFGGPELSARVSAYPNSAVPVSRVVENAATLWLEQPGTLVTEGQAVLQLEGSEVHHFLTEYQTRKAHFQLVEKRYNDNRALFARQAISSGSWQEISLAYQTALLDFEHLDHFYERISSIRDDHLQITLSAPMAGVLLATDSADSTLFRVIAAEQVRLQGTLTDQQAELTAIGFGSCQLDIARLEAVSQGFSRIWWSAPLTTQPACQANWQQHLSVVPLYAKEVFRVPGNSIVRHNSQQHVWLKSAASLRLVPVTILAKDADSFWVQSAALSSASEILSQSVSAVYGHYLGLGGE